MLEAKIEEDIEKQTVSKLHWDGEVPGTSTGTRAAADPSLGPARPTTGSLEERKINSSLLCQTGRTEKHQDGVRCLKSVGGIKMKWEMHRGGVHPLGLWMPARSLPEKPGSQATPGEGEELGHVRH